MRVDLAELETASDCSIPQVLACFTNEKSTKVSPQKCISTLNDMVVSKTSNAIKTAVDLWRKIFIHYKYREIGLIGVGWMKFRRKLTVGGVCDVSCELLKFAPQYIPKTRNLMPPNLDKTF